MNCPQCQHENPDGAKFCMECGGKLENVCPKCGAKLASEAKFCMECGTKIGEATSKPAEASVPRLEDVHAKLQRSMPGSLAAQMQAAADTEGENRIISILFADVSSSVAVTENMPPEDAADLVSECLKAMVDAILKYEGSINRFLGDSVLAFFGTPETHENDPERAVLAAMEMQEAVNKLELDITIGINTGMVYVGTIGPDSHREFTAMGAAVNLAARLEKEAEPGQILVGQSTYRLTRRAFEYTPPQTMNIRGISEPVNVYQLIKPLPRPEKIRGIEGLRAELIGRAEELGKLKDALMDVLSGSGQMVSLIGEAGVGKSRLVAELKESGLGPRDYESPMWLEGRCLSLGMTASYWPFIDMFQQHFGWSSEDSEGVRARRITSSLQDMVERGELPEKRLKEIGPPLGNLLSTQFGNDWDDKLRSAEPEQIKHQTFIAVRDFFIALAKRKPIVLVFEDLHWADTLSLDLISLLMETLTLAPLLLLCVYRPEKEHKCWHLSTIASQKCFDRYTEIHLRELSSEQSRRLVQSLLSFEDLPASVKELILAKSQGNPFFVEEVVRSLIDTGMVYQDGDAWRAQEGIESTAVPESIQSVILSRVDHLEQELRHVLQGASVIGRLFRRRLLERVTQREVDLERDLWELEDQQLIYQERAIPEEEYSFRHVLTQETVYHNILVRRRAAFHQQVAEAIEKLYRNSLVEYYEQLAYHYDKGGNVEKAVEYLLKAGDKTEHSYAYEEAIGYLTRGLELLKTLPKTPERDRRELELQLALGVPLVFIRGIGTEVEATYARAQELCKQFGDPAQLFHVLHGLRRHYLIRGNQQTAHDLGEQLLSLAREMKDPIYVSRAHLMMSEALLWFGQFIQAQEHLERGISLYDPQQLRSHIFLFGNDPGLFQVVKVISLWYLGYPDQALNVSCEALAHARELSHPYSLAATLLNIIHFRRLRRDAQVVQELIEELLRISTEQGSSFFLKWAPAVHGWAFVEQGQVDQGIAEIREGIVACRATQSEGLLVYFLTLLTQVYRKTDTPEDGLGAVAEALALVDRTGMRSVESELYRHKGELLMMQGADETEVEACFQRAIDVARGQQAKLPELQATMSLCRLWQKQGRKEEGRQTLQEIYGWFTEGFGTRDLKEAKALLEELS